MLSNKPSLAYGDPLGGAYTTAKNNGVAPECWNCSHNLVPSMLSQPHFEQSGRIQLPLPKGEDLESSETPKNSGDNLRG
jgi:hypothetical protein